MSACPLGVIAERDGRIVGVNAAALRILQYDDAHDLVGLTRRDLLYPAALSVPEPLPSFGEGCCLRPGEQELRLLRRDGSCAELALTLLELPYQGRASTVLMLRDVAEPRRMVRRLRMAEHMASLGTLVAGLAHELSNPLAYVLANLGFAEEELAPPRTELSGESLDAMRELIMHASHGAQRLHAILGDLKAYSRTSGDDASGADVRRSLDAAIEVAWHEIRLRARIERSYLRAPCVRAPASRLGQVLLNLLINAAQAIPVGSADENCISVTVDVRNGRAVIEIADSGSGIPPQHRDAIFEPFYTTKPVGVGTGLGLPISRDIVRDHGGELSLVRTGPDGTMFRVELPLAGEAEQPSQEPVRSLSPASRRARILVIDDEPAIGRILVRALRGHDVTLATCGRDGLELLERDQSYHVVFCDLAMADFSGVALYEHVAERFPELARRFVFMTGGAFTPEGQALVDEARHPVVHKPFEVQQLLELVERIRAAG